MLAFLRDANDAWSTIRSFDTLFRNLSPRADQILPMVLADNGSDFSNPARTEADADGVVRTRMFYCNSSAPHQKGSAERNHELIRYFIPKGKDRDFLTLEMVAHMKEGTML